MTNRMYHNSIAKISMNVEFYALNNHCTNTMHSTKQDVFVKH